MEGDIFKMCQREHGNFRDPGQKKSRKAKEEKNISKSQRAKSRTLRYPSPKASDDTQIRQGQESAMRCRHAHVRPLK
jgi:hypothetical protein